LGHAGVRLEGFLRDIRSDIWKLCLALHFEPSWQQWDLLQAVQIATHGFPSRSRPSISHRATANLGLRYLAAKSGQGIGKTSASVVAAIFRQMQAPNALTMVTAPTMDQCREVWLSEARSLLRNAEPFLQRYIEVTKSRIIFAGQPDYAIKFVTAVREQNAQGRHNPNMTWIADEASGIPRPLCVQIEGTLSNLDGPGMNGLFLVIGNPNTQACYFYDCFHRDRHHWWTITFNAEEAPPHICSPARNQLLAEKYGKDSDVYRVRVLGEFPRSDVQTLMAMDDLEACTKTDPVACSMLGEIQPDGRILRVKQIGIDFARFGGDESTVYARVGNAIVRWHAWTFLDPNIALDRAFAMRKELGWSMAETMWVPDAGGMGQGIMQRFYDAGANVLEFHFGGNAYDSDFYDRGSEAFFGLARKVRRRECFLPNDPRLLQQLGSRWYRMKEDRGKTYMAVESKEDHVDRLRKELGSTDTRGARSPDRADGCVMATYDYAGMRDQIAGGGER